MDTEIKKINFTVISNTTVEISCLYYDKKSSVLRGCKIR